MGGIRAVLLVASFAIQAAGILYARFVPTRYLCWAPYDQISFYRIEVEEGGRVLPPTETAHRYRLPAEGRENRAIQHVFDAIAQYEATYGRHDDLLVRVFYRTNGRSEQTWTLVD